MPSILFNSRQRRRVLALSFRIMLHTTYVRHSPETHTDTRYTLILIDNTVGSKLTTADTQTVTESSKHSDRINISFYGHWSQAKPLSNQRCVATTFIHPCIRAYIS